MVSEPIDITRFKELSDGDPKGLRELVELYIVKTSDQVRDLEKALDHNASEVARIAHSLVGANAMVGIDHVIPLLRRLEAAGETQDLTLARTLSADLHREFERIHRALQQAITSSPSS